jgi:hypothetical protein
VLSKILMLLPLEGFEKYILSTSFRGSWNSAATDSEAHCCACASSSCVLNDQPHELSTAFWDAPEISGTSFFIFILGAMPRICETAKHKSAKSEKWQ